MNKLWVGVVVGIIAAGWARNKVKEGEAGSRKTEDGGTTYFVKASLKDKS